MDLYPKDIIKNIEINISTKSGSKEFNTYSKQTYLDNALRGGLPITLAQDKNKAQTFYVYSRKHGDIERDYNRFCLSPTFYSQGNGNYRDVNQNRRSDIAFNPELGMESIIQMMLNI